MHLINQFVKKKNLSLKISNGSPFFRLFFVVVDNSNLHFCNNQQCQGNMGIGVKTSPKYPMPDVKATTLNSSSNLHKTPQNEVTADLAR